MVTLLNAWYYNHDLCLSKKALNFLLMGYTEAAASHLKRFSSLTCSYIPIKFVGPYN